MRDRLQRSHDLAAVERLVFHASCAAPAKLQRSHDLAAVESVTDAPWREVGFLLQRSHDLAAVERKTEWAPEVTTVLLQRSHDLAAVERHKALGITRYRWSFNGATTSRPWRAGEALASSSVLHPASTEPRPRGRGERSSAALPPYASFSLQRSHDLAAVESGLIHSHLGCPPVASTEPRPRGRGEDGGGERPASAVPSFNGATTSRPWRVRAPVRPGRTESTLQRSHDLAAVESNRCWAPSASTSGLQRSHDLAAVERLLAHYRRGRVPVLQRSHDLAAVESARRLLHGAARLLLQRSHDLAAVESRVVHRLLESTLRGFNGATTSRPWRVNTRLASKPLARCFNGATTSRPWRGQASVSPSASGSTGFNGATTSRPWRASTTFGRPKPLWRLQRSHDLAAVERPPVPDVPPVARDASTEPRPRGRGEGGGRPSTRTSRSSFNGATTSRPWREQGPAYSRAQAQASTEPRPRGRGEA